MLGQRKVDAKSCEITAVPELLAYLNLEGRIVSVNAPDCQKKIAAQIVEQQGDYQLALKVTTPAYQGEMPQSWLRCVSPGENGPLRSALEHLQ